MSVEDQVASSGRATAVLEEPDADRLDLPLVLAALADPGRLAIVRALAEWGEECCVKVGERAGLTVGKSTLSHHLKVLREAGLIHTRVQGTRRLVTLRAADLEQRFPGLLAMLRDPATHQAGPAAA